MELSAIEIRVLGCLVEKGATTPEHYPLTTNALVAACNQKTSREPVTAYSEREVVDAMLLLRPAGYARTISGGRAQKHRHVLDEVLGLDPDELAVLAVLMLRGPQSPGELRTRTDRYVEFESLDDVEAVLQRLGARDEALVVDLGRGPGQSQNRWMHLLGDGSEPIPAPAAAESPSPSPSGPSLADRVTALEARIAALESELGI